MNAPTDNDLLLDLIESVAVDVLTRLGDDPDARFDFFKRFVELAREFVGDAPRVPGRPPTQ